MADQPCFTLISVPNEFDLEPTPETQLRKDLETGTISQKLEAMKRVIVSIINGERMPNLLMTVIRFVMPLQDHSMKKLLLIFWEVVPKYNTEGRLLHEMILVCDAYRKDLQHPNEFIRGSTLRFLCKLKEQELLEPLMPSIRNCLEHRHAYVRRNAVLAIFTIYKNFTHLIPDAPELILKFLEMEQDASCKRNAFMMLIHVDQEKALTFLSSCLDQVNSFGDILQLVIVELIYKVCHANPNERSRFIRCVYNLLNSESRAVQYEAAGTLLTLSNAPTAVKAAATAYIEIIIKESDNNVKLIVLDRLTEMLSNSSQEKVLQELTMDVLRVLTTPDLEVRRKTLTLALDLVTSRNVEEMVMILKKEVIKTASETGRGEQEDMGKYRQLLVRALHQCANKFPATAGLVIPVLMEFLSDRKELGAALDVLLFIRETVERQVELRPLIVERLMEVFSSIQASKVFRAALWILGEYGQTVEDVQGVMTLVRQSLGDLPIVDDELRRAQGSAGSGGWDGNVGGSGLADDNVQLAASQTQRLVTADGTYATQSAFTQQGLSVGGGMGKCSTGGQPDYKDRPPLRRFLLEGEFFIGAALATSLSKLSLRFLELESSERKQNAFIGESMLILASIIHFGRSGLADKPITDDDMDRISTTIRILAERTPVMKEIFYYLCRNSLAKMLQSSAAAAAAAGGGSSLIALGGTEKIAHKNKRALDKLTQPDNPITFTQLVTKNELGAGENLFEATMNAALGHSLQRSGTGFISSSKLNRVTQLAGFSDPVYAETYVNVNQYDIVLDVLVVNQTNDTLQNLTLELSCLGDLRLVEKPQPLTMGPHDFANIKASIKVSSTENGIIFGSIVYDIRGAASDRSCVVLNDIHIDVMDYIVPSTCSETEFRQMWAEFEWENKVAVNTNIGDMREYIEHILRCTNMNCLTPDAALDGDCGFMAANLYAKSVFGEDALANVSLEKPLNAPKATPVIGHIRIRAKSQGMALSLGDKLSNSQKKTLKPSEQAADQNSSANQTDS